MEVKKLYTPILGNKKIGKARRVASVSEATGQSGSEKSEAKKAKFTKLKSEAKKAKHLAVSIKNSTWSAKKQKEYNDLKQLKLF